MWLIVGVYFNGKYHAILEEQYTVNVILVHEVMSLKTWTEGACGCSKRFTCS